MRSIVSERRSSRPCLEGGAEPGCMGPGANQERVSLNPPVLRTVGASSASPVPAGPTAVCRKPGRRWSPLPMWAEQGVCGSKHTFNPSSCFPAPSTPGREHSKAPILEPGGGGGSYGHISVFPHNTGHSAHIPPPLSSSSFSYRFIPLLSF